MDFLCKIKKHLTNISTNDDIQRYSTNTYAKINEFRLQNKLCDVILKVHNIEFPAHKIVLAAASDFFSAMFSSGMAESEQSVIELKSISIDIINEVLEYIYTGNVNVTNENVQELLPASNLTQLIGLKQACCIYLMKQVDPSNVLGIRRFAEIHDCILLEKFSRKYAAHNMEAVLKQSEEFVQLSRTELRHLIKMKDLNIYTEESVYNAVIRWIYYSKDIRVKWLPHLLSKVRLSQLSIKFLTDVVSTEPLIRESLLSRDLVDEAKLYHLRPDMRLTLMKRSFHDRYWSRNDGANNHFLVLIGGFGSDQAPISSVEIFDPRSQRWAYLPNLPGRYRYVAACSIASCIYVIGGFDGRERLNTVSVLDIGNLAQGWHELATMQFKRGLAATCAYNGKIYVCGGFDGIARLKSLEVYDPALNQWNRKENMETSREGAGLVVVDSFLYCVGGYNGMQLLDTVEKYNILDNQWSKSESMHYRRSGAGCAVMHETIYVCGGYGGAIRQGPQHLDSVECFNTLTQQWSFITSMQEPRCYIGACQMDNMIWVAAGYDGNRLLNTVEAHDRYGICSSNQNTWITFKSCPMRHERCDTGMCMVRLFQLAEPIHQPVHEKNQKSTNMTIIGETSRSEGEVMTQTRTLETGETSEVLSNHELRQSLNILFPISAPYNSQSGQPVPAHVTRRDTIVFDTYPFDESGTEEVEGRGGPQFNIVGQSSIVNLDVPGSVQGGPEPHYSGVVGNAIDSGLGLDVRLERTSRYMQLLNPTFITTVEANTNSPVPLTAVQQSGRSIFRHTSSILPHLNYEHTYIESPFLSLSELRNGVDRTTLAWMNRVESIGDTNTLLGISQSTNQDSGLDNQNALFYLDRVLNSDRYSSVTSLSSEDANENDEENIHLLNVSMPFLLVHQTAQHSTSEEMDQEIMPL